MAWHRLAALYVQMGEAERYRAHCAKSLQQFGNTKDPYAAERIAKDCMVLPFSGADLQTVARLASLAAASPTNHPAWGWFQFCKALSDYRLGRFDDALQAGQLAQSHAGTSQYLDAEAKLIIAIAQWQLGQTRSARDQLDKAGEAVVTKFPNLESGNLGDSWNDWIYTHVLLREAKALIEGATTARATTQ